MITQGLYYKTADPSTVVTVIKVIDHTISLHLDEPVALVFGISCTGCYCQFGMLENSWTRLI